jgi:hypothetical protein
MKTWVNPPISRVGARTFSYNDTLHLTSKAIDGIFGSWRFCG